MNGDVTIRYAAHVLGHSLGYVAKLKSAGKLRGVHGHIERASLDEYLASRVKTNDLGPRLPKEAKRMKAPPEHLQVQQARINGIPIFI
jgi:hypothetical protein